MTDGHWDAAAVMAFGGDGWRGHAGRCQDQGYPRAQGDRSTIADRKYDGLERIRWA